MDKFCWRYLYLYVQFNFVYHTNYWLNALKVFVQLPTQMFTWDPPLNLFYHFWWNSNEIIFWSWKFTPTLEFGLYLALKVERATTAYHGSEWGFSSHKHSQVSSHPSYYLLPNPNLQHCNFVPIVPTIHLCVCAASLLSLSITSLSHSIKHMLYHILLTFIRKWYYGVM